MTKSNHEPLILLCLLLATFSKNGHASSLRHWLPLASRAHTVLIFLLTHSPFCVFHLISPTLYHWVALGLRPWTLSWSPFTCDLGQAHGSQPFFYTEGPKFISLPPNSPLLKIPTWMFKSHLKLTMSKPNSPLPFQKYRTFSSQSSLSQLITAQHHLTSRSGHKPGSPPWFLPPITPHPTLRNLPDLFYFF